MFPGVMALFERSLRVDARSWGPHLARFGLIVTIYVALIIALREFIVFGAPGWRFFRSVAYLNLTFMTLLGISFFSTVITEEKEENTLGLMLMAGISPLGILLGKSGGPLVQALLLVAVQYPFTLLAITMGGITPIQVQSTYIAQFAYLVMLSGIGLLLSTVTRRSQTAATLMLLGVVAYWGIPLSCSSFLRHNPGTPQRVQYVLDWIGQSCVFFEMGTVLTTGFNDPLFSPQVISNLVVGGLGFLFSWVLFGLAVREPSSEASSRGMLARSSDSVRWFSPGRPGNPIFSPAVYKSSRWPPTVGERLFFRIGNPIMWKDFHFIAGGKAGVLIRLAFFVLLYAISYVLINEIFSATPVMLPLKEATRLYLTLSMIAISLDMGLLVSRSLQYEIRSQTLVTLILLPISTNRILYGKIGGVLLCWLASASCVIGGLAFLPGGPECASDFFFPTHQGGMIGFWLIAHLCLLPHLAGVFAVFARWGALPLAIGTTIGGIILESSMISSIRGPSSDFLMLATIGILFLCAVCHVIVGLRIETLGGR